MPKLRRSITYVSQAVRRVCVAAWNRQAIIQKLNNFPRH